MRVVLFSEAFAPQVNGVVRTQSELVNYLRQRGHEVLQAVPYYRANGRPPDVVEFKAVPFPLYPEMPIILPHWKFHRQAFAQIEAFRPDLVHLMSPGVLAYFGRIWARRHGCPVVASYETDVIRYMHYYGFGRFEPLLWRYLRWLFNNCRHTYVPSGVTKEQLLNGGIRDVRVFDRGVDSVLFHPAKRSIALRGALGVGADGILVLYAGRLSREKNLELLLAAFQRLAGRHPNLRLVLAGEGPHRRALVWRFRSAEITFTGWKKGEELAALVASADIFALPSTTETLSLISLEAMASGVPVIAMNAGGVRDVVENGRTGLLANSNEEFAANLRLLVEDAALRCKLGRQGREVAQQRTWTHALQKLEQNYFEAVTVKHEYAYQAF